MTAPDETELPKIGAPAARALTATGITSLADVRRSSLDDIAALHGVGPKAIRLLQEALGSDDTADAGDDQRGGGPMPDMSDSLPNREHTERYADGGVKAHGQRTGGELDGYWEWFRKDGSRMRSGSFAHGVQVGEWVTYDRSGEPYKVTQMKSPAATS